MNSEHEYMNHKIGENSLLRGKHGGTIGWKKQKQKLATFALDAQTTKLAPGHT